MKDKEILILIQDIFRDILNDKNLVINSQSTPENIKGWDSLVTINIIVAVEEQLKIKFSIDEITSINSVEDLITTVEKHL